jgi:hypothetical protein
VTFTICGSRQWILFMYAMACRILAHARQNDETVSLALDRTWNECVPKYISSNCDTSQVPNGTLYQSSCDTNTDIGVSGVSRKVPAHRGPRKGICTLQRAENESYKETESMRHLEKSFVKPIPRQYESES